MTGPPTGGEWQMIDPTGALVVELRDYFDAVGALEGSSRRGLAATAIGDAVYGDRKGADRVAPYVILRRLGPALRKPRAPFARFRYSATCVGTTEAEASTVWGLVSDWLSARGPRRRSGGVAIYLSTEELGAQASLDPDTSEPIEVGIYFVSVPLAQA